MTKIDVLYYGNLLTVDNAEAFLCFLIKGLGLGAAFHPDTRFSEYADDKGDDLFTDRQALTLELQMDQCFNICKVFGVDIYGMALRIANEHQQKK